MADKVVRRKVDASVAVDKNGRLTIAWVDPKTSRVEKIVLGEGGT